MPKPEERVQLVIQMHEDLGHFGEQKTLAEICQSTSGTITLKMSGQWLEDANNANYEECG